MHPAGCIPNLLYRGSPGTPLLLLYYCFTGALQVLLYWGPLGTALILLYYCFTTALLGASLPVRPGLMPVYAHAQNKRYK